MRSKYRIFTSSLMLLLTAVTVIAAIERQAIFDWLRLRDYQPSAEIMQLASDTTMNEPTKRLFYVYHPALEDRAAFGQNCPSKGEKTIILGCYVNRRGIYLFDVQDSRLAGIEQVTAAHEMLHAAYDRLGSQERAHVNAMVENAYSQVKDDRVHKTIESYRDAGDDVSNELHSILGTEVRDLPQDLEAYYSRYFSNREKVVEFSESYENEFTRRENEAKSLLAQIESIEAALPAKRAAIDALEQQLDSQYHELEQERHTIKDASAFNAKVSAYNNQVSTYRQLITDFNRLVEEHNALLAKYNAVALEENELIQAIDSRTSSIPSE